MHVKFVRNRPGQDVKLCPAQVGHSICSMSDKCRTYIHILAPPNISSLFLVRNISSLFWFHTVHRLGKFQLFEFFHFLCDIWKIGNNLRKCFHLQILPSFQFTIHRENEGIAANGQSKFCLLLPARENRGGKSQKIQQEEHVWGVLQTSL